MLPTIHKKARKFWQCLVVGVVMLGSMGLASSQAYGWGSGTHNYVADVLGSTQGLSNYQEMYGAMALDTFNFKFDPYSVYMADLLHTDAAMQVWKSAMQRSSSDSCSSSRSFADRISTSTNPR